MMEIKNKFGYIISVAMRNEEKKTGFIPISKIWINEWTFFGLIAIEGYATIMNY
ncbi:hypothetical protein [Paenimyroides tangerinum]|uniref:hypothetical protein n=1 Tax=Paenimyroides tangerinum TaxID=2488728 RepID=UPI001F271725|nr:hypothetical protein [Paenimyroides tangerinum]